MTFAARSFRNLEATLRNANVVLEPAGREVIRVPEAVAGLRHVLAREFRRRVAIVANRGVAMARFQPSVVLLVHHVTVRARLRVVGHVRIAARVNKCVSADADGGAQQNSQHDTLNSPQPHLSILKPL